MDLNVTANFSQRFVRMENSSSEEPFSQADINAAFHVQWIVYPVLLTCCTVGNVLNLIVLLKERHKGSTNVYLTTVAVADLFILWLFVPFYLYNVSPMLRKSEWFLRGFRQFHGMQRWGQETFIQLSDWTLLVFSTERLLVVWNPFRFYRNKESATRSRITVTLLLIFAGLFTLFDVIESYYKYFNEITTKNIDKLPAWLSQWGKLQEEAEISVTIFKFFALLTVNTMLVIAIRRQETSETGQMRTLQERRARTKQMNSNVLLLGSVLLYIVTQAPQQVVNCLMIADDRYQTYDFPKSTRRFINPFITMAFLTNYSVNFFLYVTVSLRYRRQAANTFQKICQRGSFTGEADGQDSPVPTKTISTRVTASLRSLRSPLYFLRVQERSVEPQRAHSYPRTSPRNANDTTLML